jgi:hypothetical protein
MKISLKFIIVFILFSGMVSCKKYLDVNTNPNSPTTPPINGLLTRVTQSTALNVFRVGNTTSYYVQYLASPNPASASDVFDQLDLSSTWTNLYDNMTDIHDLQKMASEQGAKQYEGVANILMAMNLQLVHNLWGAAPYAQAFTATTLTPQYDNAQTVYQRIQTLLDDAIVLLQATGSSRTIPVATSGARVDLIHNGSTAAWLRTAHALKARMLNQLSKTSQYNTTNIFAALANAYTSSAHDAFVNVFDVRNPWNQLAVNNDALVLDAWLSQHFVRSMDGSLYGVADPRLPLIASLTRFNDYRGTRNGAGRVGSGTTKDESYLSLTGYYSSPAAPLFIITYDEMKFIEAEVAFRTNDRPRAYAAYLEGIRANMTKMNVAAAARDAYINNPLVSVGSGNLTLELIFREKWKATFLMPVTWDDARRFDYQYQGFMMPLNVLPTTWVRRIHYPSVEDTRNGANVPEVTTVTQRLWWDAN